MKKGKKEILIKQLQSIGIYGIKSFAAICLKKHYNPKVIRVKSKMIGTQWLYLRTHSSDIRLANCLLGKDSEYAFLKKMPEILNAKVIVDGGANIGLFSRICRTLNKEAKIYAIEAEKDNFAMLEKNTKKANVICLKNGLWNSKARLKVHPRPTENVGFFCEEVKNGMNYDVEAISVADILSEYKIEFIDVLKIDIEGSEYFVFDETSENWIDKVGVFIIELHDYLIEGVSERVINRLRSFGFEYIINGENYIFKRNRCNSLID